MELTEDMALPLERLEAEVLMVVGEDDYNFDSVMNAELAKKRCDEAGRTNLTVEARDDAPRVPPGLLGGRGAGDQRRGAGQGLGHHHCLPGGHPPPLTTPWMVNTLQ